MKRKGISLIVLIITIVVIIILATAIILNLAQTNITKNASNAVLKSDIASLKSELDLYVSDEFVTNKGKYDRTKLNANESIATYDEENIIDKNSDGKTDIYDILNSLKNSSLDGAVYIEEGKLVFRKSMFTNSQLEILTQMGEEVDGMPKISSVTSESDYTSITVKVSVSDPTQVKRYIYELADEQKIETESNMVTFENLTMDARYILKITAILKDETEITKLELLSTKSIDGNIEFVKSETEITSNDVEVELLYENEMPEGYELQYRVTREEDGETVTIQDWIKYTEKIIIDTNNTKVTARLYNNELEDEKLATSLTISNIDKEPPATPVIESNYGYPIITEYGIKIDGSTTITYDTQYGITNLYSIDGGTTWNEYTGSFNMSSSGIIMAKSIKTNKLETTVTKTVDIPSDALGGNAYDGEDSTYVSSSNLLYLLVDSTVIGATVTYSGFHANYSGNTTQYLKYLDADKKEIETVFTKTNTGNSYSFSEESVIPEGTAYIAYNAKYTGNRLYEIVLHNEPTIVVEPTYPKLTEYGVEAGYDNIIINYYQTSTQKLYKIGEGEWQVYQNEPIKLELEETIYAKGIDKYGVETDIVSYVSALPSDALGENAYDEEDSTYVSSSNLLYLVVDSTAIGTTVTYSGFHANYSGNTTQYVKYLDVDKKEIETVFTKTNTGNSYSFSEESVIPEGTVYIAYNAKYTGNKLYEIVLHNEPTIVVEPTYPKLTEYGVEAGYDNIIINYYQTSTQKLYKIGEGEWQVYQNEPIKLELEETIYAKGIDKYGVETDIVSYVSALPSDALGENAYDGKDSTYVSSSNLLYLVVDSTAIGTTVTYSGFHANYSGNTTQYVKYLDADKKEIETVFTKTNTGNSYSFSEESVIPEGTVYIAYNAKYTGNKLYEIYIAD